MGVADGGGIFETGRCVNDGLVVCQEGCEFKVGLLDDTSC